MNSLVPIAIFGWIPVVLGLFLMMPPRRAVIVSFLVAWLFLPIASFKYAGIPDIDKMAVTCVGALLGTMMFDPSRFATLRPTLADLPMLAWIMAPLPSALTSGFGPYEGASGVFTHFVEWGMPYLVGRLYMNDAEGMRELAISLFVGGLIYTPLVVFEARMSPQLHTWVYGYHQHEFAQTKRGDAWRPTVFMQHGLAVALFMGTSAVSALWLWSAGKIRTFRGVPMWMLAVGLFAVVFVCRSSYALLLMLSGAGLLFVGRSLRTRAVLMFMLAIPPCYVSLRTVGGWDAGLLRDVAMVVAPQRIESFEQRLGSEDVCWKWVQAFPVFGGGRLVAIMDGRNDAGFRFIPDGLWLIALGKNGIFGLAAMLSCLLLPAALYIARHKESELYGMPLAGATIMATVLVLYTLDNLLNAMVNPIYLLGAGGLATLRINPPGADRLRSGAAVRAGRTGGGVVRWRH